jgi:hypothetical protein
VALLPQAQVVSCGALFCSSLLASSRFYCCCIQSGDAASVCLLCSVWCMFYLLVPSAVRWCCFGCFLGYPSEVGVITEISLRNLSTSFLFCCFGPFPSTTLPERGPDVPIKNSEDALARGAGTTATATTIWKWDAGCGCPPRHCESHEANTDHCPPRACGSPHQTTCSSSCRPIERCRRLLLHPVCEGGQGGEEGLPRSRSPPRTAMTTS